MVDDRNGPIPPSGRQAGGEAVSSPVEPLALIFSRFEQKIKDLQAKGWKTLYCTFSSTENLIGVVCKRCGATIRLWDDKTGTLKPFSNYVELSIECSEGGHHVTCVCADCVRELTQDDLNNILLIDAHQMLVDAARTKHKLSDSFVSLLINRKAK